MKDNKLAKEMKAVHAVQSSIKKPHTPQGVKAHEPRTPA